MTARQVRVIVVLDRRRFGVHGVTCDPAEAIDWFDDLIAQSSPGTNTDEVARLWVGHVAAPEEAP